MFGGDNACRITFTWGPRAERSEEIAERLLHFIESIVEIGNGFHGWRLVKDRNRDVDLQSITSALETSVNRTDVGNIPIPEGGFNVALVNDDSWILRLRSGGYSEFLPNCLAMQISGAGLAKAIQLEKMTRLTDAIVESFAPEYGVVSFQDVDELIEERELGVDVGWLTWIADTALPPILPDGISRLSLSDGSSLILAKDDFLNSQVKEQGEALLGVAELVAGLVSDD